jgi:hypothetical protein
MEQHQCRDCKETKPEDQFFRTSKISKKTGVAYLDKWCKICRNTYHRENRREAKAWGVAYKGGKCRGCGYDKCHAALDFHHLDPNEKDFDFKEARHNKEELAKELDKCILLCRNCHAEVHYGVLDTSGL